MGGAAFASSPTLAGGVIVHERARHSVVRTFTLTAARAAMFRQRQHSGSHNDHTKPRTPYGGGDAEALPLEKDDNGVSDRPPVSTPFPVTESAISQADGEP